MNQIIATITVGFVIFVTGTLLGHRFAKLTIESKPIQMEHYYWIYDTNTNDSQQYEDDFDFLR